jgi:hypothetical protein
MVYRSVSIAVSSRSQHLMAVARGVPRAPGREKKMGLLKEQNNRRLDAPWDDQLPSHGLAPCGLHPRIECPVCLAAGIE